MTTSSRPSMTTTDNVERRQLNDSSVTVSTGDKPSRPTPFQLKYPVQQNSSGAGRSTQRLTPEHQAAPSPTGSGGGVGGRYRVTDGGARGKRRSGVVERGSDSDSRRRDERVTFAADTVVQTSDGRAVIVDDSAAGGDGRSAHPRRVPSATNTLPARLRGQAVRRTLPELDQKERTDVHVDRVVRRPVQRSQTRPVSAVFDDDALRFGSSSSPAARTDSVPASMNVLHRGNSTFVAKSRDVGVPHVATRRAVDSNYYRDPASASARAYRR